MRKVDPTSVGARVMDTFGPNLESEPFFVLLEFFEEH
jgi:hypothetical protein